MMTHEINESSKSLTTTPLLIDAADLLLGVLESELAVIMLNLAALASFFAVSVSGTPNFFALNSNRCKRLIYHQ